MPQISESEREKIKIQAKQILDDFSKSLDQVKVKSKKTKNEVGGFREEGEGRKADSEFRKKMFSNAPQKDENNILAEKKSW